MDSTWQGTVLLADLRRDASRLYASAGPTKALQAIQNCVAVLERAAWDGGATFADFFLANVFCHRSVQKHSSRFILA